MHEQGVEIADVLALDSAHLEGRIAELAAGTFVRGLPPEAPVASFDIGGIGWAADRSIVDLGGLGDPAVAVQLEEGRTWEILAANKIAFVILPSEYAPRLLGEGDFRSRLGLRDNPAVSLLPVYELATPPSQWLPAVDATSNAAAVQIVYAVEYTGVSPPRTMRPPPPRERRVLRDPPGLIWDQDRAVAEHMLAVLEAWGLVVDLRTTDRPLEPASEGETGCAVVLGPSGLAVEGCALLGEHRAVEGAVFELALPYLDANDFGGAARAAVHAVARARQRLDPTFAPKLAPLPQPRSGGGESITSRTAGWGVPLMLVVFLVAWVLRYARVIRRRLRRFVAPASAIGIMLMLVGCHRADALPRAATEGPDEVAAALARGAAVEDRDDDGRTALLVAAAQCDAEVVKLLLARGASAEAHTKDGTTALHLAARKACTPCARLLAPATVERNAVAGLRRRTALHDAVLTGDEKTVAALIAAGLDANKKDAFGATPLHLLANARRSSVVAPGLVAGGADWRIQDGRGFTGLDAAAAADDALLLRVLVAKAGSAIDEVDARGETALDVALRYHADRAAEVLLVAGAVPRSAPPLHEAARMDDVERATRLVTFGVDLSRAYEGKTAGEVARERRSERVIAVLGK